MSSPPRCPTSPALVDFDGDGRRGSGDRPSDGKLFAFTGADGDTVPGWPVALASSINSSPAVWDLDLDGHPDVLVGTNSGKLWALHGNGTTVAGWPVQLTGSIYGGPAVGGQSRARRIRGLRRDRGRQRLTCSTRSRNVMPGWPKHVNGAI
jgi:hypothetical protein